MSIEEWTLVTVTHNNASHLREHWSASAHGDARWIVVDNASSDESVAVASRLGADVVPLATNVGFAAANNVGLARAATEWIAFVNPDVTVSGPGLDLLAETAARHGALVAPQLVNPDGSPQPNGRGFPFLVDKFSNRGVRLPGARPERYTPLERHGEAWPAAWVIGAAVAGRRDTFERLGGWDDRYFLYYEDHDLGLRAWRAGYSVLIDPRVRWVHAWQRATMKPKWGPWRHELSSAVRFYRTYPEFFLPLRRLGSIRHPRANNALVGEHRI